MLRIHHAVLKAIACSSGESIVRLVLRAARRKGATSHPNCKIRSWRCAGIELASPPPTERTPLSLPNLITLLFLASSPNNSHLSRRNVLGLRSHLVTGSSRVCRRSKRPALIPAFVAKLRTSDCSQSPAFHISTANLDISHHLGSPPPSRLPTSNMSQSPVLDFSRCCHFACFSACFPRISVCSGHTLESSSTLRCRWASSLPQPYVDGPRPQAQNTRLRLRLF